jgi:hypothetical protein
VEWRRLLEQRPELKPVAEDASVEGMLVFGVKGTPAGARQVAQLLDGYRRDLMRRYFDSGLPGPTMVVLANLASPEAPMAAAAPQTSNSPGTMANLAARPLANAAAQPPGEQRSQPQRQEVQQQQIQSPMEQRSLGSERPRRQGASPEALGLILSATVHFREMADMEGYFEPLDHTLVLRKNLVNDRGQMLLGTGLHELVHALILVDYPQAPMWLNEGMAALHEEYGPSEPHDNYRLYVARAAMTSGRWLTLRELIEPNPAWWNSEARPVMVAAARYFCMFLWKKGLLPAVYRAMRQAQATGDVAAAEVLRRVAGMPVAQLETRWREDMAGRDLNSLDARWGELRQPIQHYIQKLPPLAGIR